jgi:hypothetical protein
MAMVKSRERITNKIDAEKTLELLIRGTIDQLSNISSWYDESIERRPDIKNAAKPNVRWHVPIFEPNPLVSWDEYRNNRHKMISEKMLNQTLAVFPLAYIDLKEIGCLHIIKDDCDDLLNVLKREGTVTPLSASGILSSIAEIIGRYYYMSGYHGLKYQREKFNRMRTTKSATTRREKRSEDKRNVKQSAKKLLGEMKLKTVRDNLSQASFIKMIRDDLPRLDNEKKMSEKKILTLLHELQDEGEVRFDPRKTKRGRM